MDEPDAGPARLPAAGHPLAAATYVSLTTYRRTGVPVSTPVWFAPSVDDPLLFTVITVDDTGKTKRLAHTDRVELRACDLRGTAVAGAPTYVGRARVVRDDAGVASVRRAVVAKYGLLARMSDLVEKVTGRMGIRRPPRAGILVAVDPQPVSEG